MYQLNGLININLAFLTKRRFQIKYKCQLYMSGSNISPITNYFFLDYINFVIYRKGTKGDNLKYVTCKNLSCLRVEWNSTRWEKSDDDGCTIQFSARVATAVKGLQFYSHCQRTPDKKPFLNLIPNWSWKISGPIVFQKCELNEKIYCFHNNCTLKCPKCWIFQNLSSVLYCSDKN